MKRLILILTLLVCASAIRGAAALGVRGVVYDVGLMYGGTSLSVADFRPEQVDYDMGVIADILGCNAVRIEGESLERLAVASRKAAAKGLRVFFNPWKMAADSAQTVGYMEQAAAVAEGLRAEGIDLVFVAGCEYTIFSKGAFPGDTFDERLAWLMKLASEPDPARLLAERCVSLNRILGSIAAAVRRSFHGPVTYASGGWESVDWSLFDYVGVDYYRNGETAEAYVDGLKHYQAFGKPVLVMEMGCCAYRGAAERGSFGFAVLQGTDSEGRAVYEGGVTPVRDEAVQADYLEENIALLGSAGADGVFVYVFSYPIYPYSADGIDYDMTSYALVKSFPATDARSQRLPAWEPKRAFFRLGEVYNAMNNEANSVKKP